MQIGAQQTTTDVFGDICANRPWDRHRISLELGEYVTFAQYPDEIPTTEKWTKWMTEAPADEALRLRQHALSCLHQNVHAQQWGVLIGIAEQILRVRGIDWNRA